jgi:lysophospholipase L1-like esterase
VSAARRAGSGARTALLLLLSLAASLALAECALRLARPQPLGFSQLSEDGLLLHRPGHSGVYRRDDFSARVSINSSGFRDAEFALPKPPGSFRILILGDSFAEAMQVHDEETLAARLRESFAGSYRPVEVLNLGVSGYGTSEELALLRLWGPKLEPDLVLLLFCLGNDVQNNAQSSLCRLENGQLACRLPTRPSRLQLATWGLRSWLGAHFHLFQLLRAATASPVLERLGLRKLAPEATPEMPFGSDAYLPSAPPYLADAYALTREILRELAATADGLGAETWLALLPARDQIWDREWDAKVAARGEPLVRDEPQRALGAIARELGLPVIDLYGAFRSRGSSEETLYWRIDAHFDAAGHALAAREIAAALRAHGIPPATPASHPRAGRP